jgi:hypothetical protein
MKNLNLVSGLTCNVNTKIYVRCVLSIYQDRKDTKECIKLVYKSGKK